MQTRYHRINLRRGRQQIAVRRATTVDGTGFIGSMNGVDCGSWPTKEAAVQAMLRRAANGLNW